MQEWLYFRSMVGYTEPMKTVLKLAKNLLGTLAGVALLFAFPLVLVTCVVAAKLSGDKAGDVVWNGYTSALSRCMDWSY